MIQLVVNNMVLDLPEGFSLKVTEKSSLFSWEMQGGFTLPFSLPRTRTNREVFGYLDVLQIIGNREQYWTAKIKKDGMELFEGTLRIKAVNEKFDCELTIPPGNIPPEIWEKSLRKFDFGSDSFPYTEITSKLWSVQIPEADVKSFGINLMMLNTYQVFINDVKIFEFLNVDEHSETDLLSVRANSFVYNFNLEKNPGLYMYVSSTGFGIRGVGVVGSAINSVKIVYEYTIGGSIGPGEIKTKEWEMAVVSYKQLNPIKIADYLNKPYSFKTIRNEAFYDKSVNTAWNGKINYVEDGIVMTNTEVTQTRYTLVPFLKLRYVFEKIAELLGYTITGSFFEHSNPDKILIYTNISTDLQCENAFVPFNIHKQTINYADYLPDVSLKAFVDSWKARLGVNFLWDYSEKTLSIDFVEDILELNQRYDWRERIPDILPLEMDGAEYSFRFEDDIYSEFKLIDINRDNPPAYYEGCLKDLNDYGTSSVEGQNVRTLAMPQLHIYEYYLYVRPRANGGGEGTYTRDKYYIANHRGVSPLFNQSGSDVRIRLFFEDVAYKPVGWQLSFFASDGIKAVLLNRLLVFLKQYRIIELYTHLNLAQLVQKDWYTKRSFGIDFYPLEFEYDLADKEETRVKLLGE